MSSTMCPQSCVALVCLMSYVPCHGTGPVLATHDTGRALTSAPLVELVRASRHIASMTDTRGRWDSAMTT
jgi:hypothetical protein